MMHEGQTFDLREDIEVAIIRLQRQNVLLKQELNRLRIRVATLEERGFDSDASRNDINNLVA